MCLPVCMYALYYMCMCIFVLYAIYICSIYMHRHMCTNMSAVCIHVMCIFVCCIAMCMCAICALCTMCMCVFILCLQVPWQDSSTQMPALNLSLSTAGAASQSQFSVLQLDGSSPLPDCNLMPALILRIALSKCNHRVVMEKVQRYASGSGTCSRGLIS